MAGGIEGTDSGENTYDPAKAPTLGNPKAWAKCYLRTGASGRGYEELQELIRDAGIYVGGYILRPFHLGGFWLENAGGEGMQISGQRLEVLLDGYFTEHF